MGLDGALAAVEDRGDVTHAVVLQIEQGDRLGLPSWQGRLTPHILRHFCASSLYAQGLDVKAIQELLGHSWLSTTTRYIHVPVEHVTQAWNASNARTAARLGQLEG